MDLGMISSENYATRKSLVLFAAITLAMFAGCDVDQEVIDFESEVQAIEQPIANLPGPLRYTNWTSRAGKGSCVIASSCSMAAWCGENELADFLRRSYSGGQTQTSIQEKLTAAQVPFICTESTDVAVLEYATRTRRMAIVWFYPRHCVSFCGFGVSPEGWECAWLLDNNRVEEFIPVPKDQFIRDWNQYGGFGLVAILTPAPPLPM
jgi:hypothetical protein